ncbi:hypothetical protein CFP66_37310 [Pseudonocardia sp. MH-G8]|nr:hypothetical protein CFP66_37310 [Pseudonocardia sp. MH-G8]
MLSGDIEDVAMARPRGPEIRSLLLNSSHHAFGRRITCRPSTSDTAHSGPVAGLDHVEQLLVLRQSWKRLGGY